MWEISQINCQFLSNIKLYYYVTVKLAHLLNFDPLNNFHVVRMAAFDPLFLYHKERLIRNTIFPLFVGGVMMTQSLIRISPVKVTTSEKHSSFKKFKICQQIQICIIFLIFFLKIQNLSNLIVSRCKFCSLCGFIV